MKKPDNDKYETLPGPFTRPSPKNFLTKELL